MRAGALRTRVRLERSVDVVNAIGEPEEEWTLVVETWAGRRVLGGSERFASEQHSSSIDTEWEFRFRTPFDPRWRIVEKENGQVHDIETVQDPDGRRRKLIVRSRIAEPQATAEWTP